MSGEIRRITGKTFHQFVIDQLSNKLTDCQWDYLKSLGEKKSHVIVIDCVTRLILQWLMELTFSSKAIGHGWR